MPEVLEAKYPLSLQAVRTDTLLKTGSVTPGELLGFVGDVMIQMDLGRGEPAYNRTHTNERRYNPGSLVYGQFGDLRLNLTATDSRLEFSLTRYDPPIPPHEGLIMPAPEVIEKNLQEETPASVLYKTFTGLAADGRHNIEFGMRFYSNNSHNVRLPTAIRTQVPEELFAADSLNPMGRIGYWKIGGLAWNIKEADFSGERGDIMSGDIDLLCSSTFRPVQVPTNSRQLAI